MSQFTSTIHIMSEPEDALYRKLFVASLGEYHEVSVENFKNRRFVFGDGAVNFSRDCFLDALSTCNMAKSQSTFYFDSRQIIIADYNFDPAIHGGSNDNFIAVDKKIYIARPQYYRLRKLDDRVIKLRVETAKYSECFSTNTIYFQNEKWTRFEHIAIFIPALFCENIIPTTSSNLWKNMIGTAKLSTETIHHHDVKLFRECEGEIVNL